ncbi:conserved hypothetical protein [Leishmania infantum JPCM5]|uniref:Uncharacterized protein n=2 Tax=Leishmania infantum TaxID=5671 RepID=A4I386_LEIIN|nr:conserved hypothetical protein [Leishmania infantum JPCM5]CAC9501612.1 hypothetical_protein_-_conserved [Leishmania infantum]CAM69240.1 conserved hypothetical protein [Leishmania infantum JPCM5]SUZ43175.1 hypothetical_protein_-_conserved [Leishmania infantum]|eukprot:XP_001470048.1 conserved hypothetical protein [Leishmania infantum JPCM5]
MHIFRVSVPLMCLFYHFVVVIISFANYIIFVKLQGTPRALCDAYLALCVVETVAYGACAGPLFVYSYKYGKTSTARLGRLLGGIVVMFLLSSLPMVIIETALFLSFDLELRHSLDGTVFFLHATAAVFGGFTTWFAYMRVVARFLQRWRGPERQIADDSEIPPTKDVQLHLVRRSQWQPETI